MINSRKIYFLLGSIRYSDYEPVKSYYIFAYISGLIIKSDFVIFLNLKTTFVNNSIFILA